MTKTETWWCLACGGEVRTPTGYTGLDMRYQLGRHCGSPRRALSQDPHEAWRLSREYQARLSANHAKGKR